MPQRQKPAERRMERTAPAPQPERPSPRPAEKPALQFPPVQAPPVRRISSEPPRVGRLVAFADGRRGRKRPGAKK